MGLRIGTVVNLPLNQLGQLAGKLDPSQPVVTVCNSAYRSSMAVGVLERKGFARVASLEGGSEAWIQAGLPVYGSEAKAVPAVAPKRHVALAERISPANLKQRMLDMPGTFDLVDIRPAEAFADYNLPGSRNVEIADLLADQGYLVGAGPLVVIDRDGSLAMMVAGILSQKTQRPIQALHGGLEAYWQNEELRPAVKAVPLPAAPAAPVASPQARPAPVPTVPATPAPAGPAVAKKKSAGC
jgi:rhodanese-related sulfurtransferase